MVDNLGLDSLLNIHIDNHDKGDCKDGKDGKDGKEGKEGKDDGSFANSVFDFKLTI